MSEALRFDEALEDLEPVELAKLQIKMLAKIWAAERDDREHAANLIRMASGDQISMIRPMPSEPPDHFRSKPKFAPNFLGMALDQISFLYADDPDRTMIVESEQDWARQHVWRFGQGLSSALAHADPLIGLTGTALLMMTYKTGEEQPIDLRNWVLSGEGAPEIPTEKVGGDDGIEAIVITRDRFAVLCNPFDPRIVEAVVVAMRTTVDTKQFSHGGHHEIEITRWHYWDRHTFAVIEADGFGAGWNVVEWQGQEISEHNLGVIPFAVLRNSEVGLGFYPDALSVWGGIDLRDNVRSIVELFSEIMWTALLQRGQPWITGESDNLALGPDIFVEVAVGGAFGIASNAANLPGMVDILQRALDALGKTIGLPSSALKVDINPATSGIAIALSRAELDEDRKARENLARTWESRAHFVASRIWNAVKMTSLEGKLTVRYKPFVIPLTYDQIQKRVEFEVGLGLMSPEDALAELRPTLTPEQITERLERAGAAQANTRAAAVEDATAVAQAAVPVDPLAALFAPPPDEA